jgi:hypothetical protein
MSQETKLVLKAVDEASETFRKVGTEAGRLSDKVGDVGKSSAKTEASNKQLLLGFNNLATSGFALYNIIDKVQDMQVGVDRANLMVKTSLNSVEDAQRRYNATLEKYDADSEQAKAAADDLKLAQERYQVACERADMMQGNLNEAMVAGAMQVIPTLITAISSVSMITGNWTAVTQGVSGALSFLSANPLVLVVAGIAALVAGLIWAYQNCEPFRDIINTIGSYIAGAFMLAWNGLITLWNSVLLPIIKTIGAALGWLWTNILAPLAVFLVERVLKGWQTMCDGFKWAYDTILKPIFDGLEWFYNNVIKPIAEFFAAGGTVEGREAGGAREQTPSGEGAYVPPEQRTAPGVGGHLQFGGIVTRPTLSWLGEAGPEAVVPLRPEMVPYSGNIVNETSVTLNFHVEGSMDRKVADYVLDRVEDVLKNTLVEASSGNAPATHKRIRLHRNI